SVRGAVDDPERGRAGHVHTLRRGIHGDASAANRKRRFDRHRRQIEDLNGATAVRYIEATMNGVDGEVTRAARRVVRGGLTRLRIDDDKTIATASGSANVDPPVAGVD